MPRLSEKKALSHGINERIAINLREVGVEKDGQAFFGTGQGDGANGKDNQNHQKQGHQYLGILLNAVLNALEDHKTRQEDEDGLQEHIEPARIVEGFEVLLDESQILAFERVGRCLENVFERPTCHDGIGGEDKQ